MKNKKNNYFYILKYLLKPYKYFLIINIFLSIISIGTLVIIPIYMGESVTELFNLSNFLNTHKQINFSRLNTIIISMIILYLLSNIASFFQQFISGVITQKIVYKLRKELSIKINKISFDYFTHKGIGNILSIITNDIDIISSSFQQVIGESFTTIITVIFVFIIIYIIDIKISLVVSIIFILMILICLPIMKKSRCYFKQQRKLIGKLNTTIEESYNGIETIQAFQKEEDIFRKFDKEDLVVKNNVKKSIYLSSLLFPILNIFTSISTISITGIGIYSVIFFNAQIGIIPTFLQYFRQMMNAVNSLGNIISLLQQSIASFDRVLEFLSQNETVDNGNKEIKTVESISFKNVDFSYVEGKPILKNINFKISSGETVGIVGKTGVGKTTLYNLLLRFYDPNSGNIYINNISIKEITRKNLRNLIGMVTQDVWLFNDTIYENIRFGNTNVTKEDILKVSKLTNCDEFINKLPNGYNTILNEDNSNLSDGQKQLLTIARVMLKNPQILVLDEATSSIDTRTEMLVDNALYKLSEGKTKFIVAHRLSTIINADIIYFIKNGEITEKGNHNELLNKKGDYYNLYISQFS